MMTNTEPTKPIDDELLEKLEHILHKYGCGDIANRKIADLITADRKRLLDRVEKEVIEKDEIVPEYDASLEFNYPTIEAEARNQRRGNERAALAKLRKELGL